MPISEQQEWEKPNPSDEPDPDEVIIPKVPLDDDVSTDSDGTDSDGDDDQDEED